MGSYGKSVFFILSLSVYERPGFTMSVLTLGDSGAVGQENKHSSVNNATETVLREI